MYMCMDECVYVRAYICSWEEGEKRAISFCIFLVSLPLYGRPSCILDEFLGAGEKIVFFMCNYIYFLSKKLNSLRHSTSEKCLGLRNYCKDSP